ncbi:MAG: flavodoxin family protein [Clostridiales bacterium]|nr:flavodoxin family protein [Clostridiales bacterium]
MKKLLIINGSPRENGVCAEMINQVRTYFLDCETRCYDTFKLSPAPCTDCKYCEYHDGCSNRDLDIFFEDFEEADYIVFFTPVYNNFFPAPLKAIIDRFQRYYSARFKRGAKPPIAKPKRVGVVIASGSNARQSADYMTATLRQSFTVLNGEVCARYYIPNTDMGKYTFNLVELQKFVHQLKNIK